MNNNDAAAAAAVRQRIDGAVRLQAKMDELRSMEHELQQQRAAFEQEKAALYAQAQVFKVTKEAEVEIVKKELEAWQAHAAYLEKQLHLRHTELMAFSRAVVGKDVKEDHDVICLGVVQAHV